MKDDQSKLIRSLAQSKKVSEGVAAVAARVAARAASLDRQGDYSLDPGQLSIRGLKRRATTVVNAAEGASRREFDRAGSRPLGRASQSVKRARRG